MSVEKITKEMFHCHCDREECGKEWDSDSIPLRCVKCKSRRWNRPASIASKRIAHNGENLTILQWARKLGLSRFAINYRLKEGWPIEQVLSRDDWRLKNPKSTT